MRGDPALLPPRAWVPCGLTFANIAVGFASMLAASAREFELAVYLLLAAIFLDLFDGRTARLLGATSRFGMELDSLSDALSFGAAPALLVYLACLEPLGRPGWAVSLAYLLAGVYRLARFNVLSDEHDKARRTVGVPIPIGAGYLMVTVLMRDRLSALTAAGVVVAMVVLMVSRWRLPDLRGRSPVSVMLLVGILNYLAVVVWPTWTTVGWWNVWNVVILLAAWREDRTAGLEVLENP